MIKKGWSTLCIICLLVSCSDNRGPLVTIEQRQEADSIVKSVRGIPALDSLYHIMKDDNNVVGEIVTLREWGKQLRNVNLFDEALRRHGEGLTLAEEINDTLEMVQALNNIGTDYRRIGTLDAAQLYHMKALIMASECSDTSFTAKKNRVVSLNGLANVYLTVGNWHLADSTLRLALAGETALHSLTGQAINYANIGSVFEECGEIDSAWMYYRKSMELNQQDENMLGVALCHTYYGNLYEKAHEYKKALGEYTKSYNLMKDSKDEWHTLNSLIALAGVYLAMHDYVKTEAYLNDAKDIADKIHSTEHLAEVYTLYYRLYKERGDWHGALTAHEYATALQDSLVDMEKVNRMQSATYNIERGQQSRRINAANDKLNRERSARHIGYVVFAAIALLLVGVIVLLIRNRQLRMRSHEALKQLNAVRESFFTNITHEFRTPLTVILGLSQDLQQDNAAPEDTKEMGRTIERQGNHILHLINQLLDISKVRSAIGIPDWRSGNIVAYIEMIVESFKSYANSHGISLCVTAQEKNIETDFIPEYINKLISNLLSNSLKFTPVGGKVEVNIRTRQNKLFVDVADNGKGIPSQSLPLIFEPFYQCDNGNSIGSGIGLALVGQIVNSLDGTISVESKEQQGTVFHITLPIKHDHADATGYTPVSHEAIDYDESNVDYEFIPFRTESIDNPNVLIVEDNADIAAYIAGCLSDKYNVLYASDGERGAEMAREKLPDIIVTDLMMPKSDGLELCRRIRSDELTSHIPVVIVTAKVTETDKIQGLEAGADAYLTKPFSRDELLMRIKKLLEQRESLRKKFSQKIFAGIDGQAEEEVPITDNRQALDAHFMNRLTDTISLMLGSGEPINVNMVASKMFVSYSQLYRKLSALTGMTPVQYIQRMKVEKAKQMLTAHLEMNFSEVADKCGFADYSSFVRAFRSVLKVTPTEFVHMQK